MGKTCRANRWSKVVLFLFLALFLLLSSAGRGNAVSSATLWAWGTNYHGELGTGVLTTQPPLGVATPTQVDVPDVTAMGGGLFHALALKADGTVWSWGQNSFGQLGNGSFAPGRDSGIALPAPVPNLTDVKAVSRGVGYHSLAVKRDGTVWGWGYNSTSPLGNDDWAGVSSPIQVPITGVSAVSAGGGHSLALKEDGTVWAWGRNYEGEVGIGAFTEPVGHPVQAPGLDNIVAVSAGGFHSLALRRDGTVWAWGSEFANGFSERTASPTRLASLTGIVAISAGSGHSLALKADGTVWCWGDGYFGQLGNGSLGYPFHGYAIATPAMVPGLTNVVQVLAGDAHSLALTADGTVWSWGYNYHGELGNGSFGSIDYPANPSPTPAISGVASLGHAGTFTLVLGGQSNHPPIAEDQTVNAREDTQEAIRLIASDPDGDPLTYTIVSPPQKGTLDFTAPNLTYRPGLNLNGVDSFTFTVSDGQAESAPATVTILIAPVNDAPVAAPDTAATDLNTAVSIPVLANDGDVDGDVLSVVSVTQGANGTASVGADGTVTYKPNEGFTGVDHFSYVVRDPLGLTATAQVEVTVMLPNRPPHAVTDVVMAELGISVRIAVLANDFDPDGDALELVGATDPVSGSVTVNPDCTITYTPTRTGRDTFTYKIRDSRGGTATGRVNVQVR